MRSETKYLHLYLSLCSYPSPAWREQSAARVAEGGWQPGMAAGRRSPGSGPRALRDAGWSIARGHPEGLSPGFGRGGLGSCGAKAAAWVDVPGFDSVPVRVFRGKQEGKDNRPILIMTFEALPNYIVSLKTTTQIFMSGIFYSHCNQ